MALIEVLSNNLEIIGLLDREQRSLFRGRVRHLDLSDQPHVISAYINKCDALIAYDSHFEATTNFVRYLEPEKYLEEFFQE